MGVPPFQDTPISVLKVRKSLLQAALFHPRSAGSASPPRQPSFWTNVLGQCWLDLAASHHLETSVKARIIIPYTLPILDTLQKNKFFAG